MDPVAPQMLTCHHLYGAISVSFLNSLRVSFSRSLQTPETDLETIDILSDIRCSSWTELTEFGTRQDKT